MGAIFNPDAPLAPDSFPSPTDDNAIHNNVNGEIDAIAEKVAPIANDILLIEDYGAHDNSKKKVKIGNLPVTDSDAIHDNVAGEINAISEKTTPAAADIVLIESAVGAYSKLKAQISNLGKGIKLDDLATPDDNTDLDFSTSKHGLVPKGTNVGNYLKDDGTWAAVSGGSGATILETQVFSS